MFKFKINFEYNRSLNIKIKREHNKLLITISTSSFTESLRIALNHMYMRETYNNFLKIQQNTIKVHRNQIIFI